jgi:diacylglycerol O-acyltransferase / wax synthase
MTYSHYERLSALDVSFLELEDHNTHMHIGAVALFDAAPLARADGGLDVDRIHHLMEAGIHRIPRYRQRLAHVPVTNHPVWVDDARFNLNYHLRHTCLPRPGDERLLKRLAGRIMSQQLDRGKPLWEMWIVEGVEGNRFALVTKVHHCMIDGVGSVELTGSVMRPTPDPDPRLDGPPPPWLPRPAPSARDLLQAEVLRRAGAPFAAVRAACGALRRPRAAATAVYEAVEGIGEAVATGLQPASPTPLNVDIGPHRRFDWLDMDLGVVRAVKSSLGGTVNDVVLTMVAGALRRFLHRRGLAVDTLDFRAMLPVNVRPKGDHALGNRVAMIVARLPLDEADPRRRLARVIERTSQLKHSRQAYGVKMIEEIGDWTFTTLFTEFARLTASSRPFNLVVTNVPGPTFRVYVQGAPMLRCYPLVPLYQNQGLGIALFSYDGRLQWGFNADWDAIPDLHDLVEAVAEDFQALREAAGVESEAAAVGGNGVSATNGAAASEQR